MVNPSTVRLLNWLVPGHRRSSIRMVNPHRAGKRLRLVECRARARAPSGSRVTPLSSRERLEPPEAGKGEEGPSPAASVGTPFSDACSPEL